MMKSLWTLLVVLTASLLLFLIYVMSAGRSLGPLTLEEPSPARTKDGKTRRLPNALIIGVKKGGTRALLEMLSLHPAIAVAHQEVHYFDRDENYDLGIEWYRKHMPWTNSEQDIILEKSPAYFVAKNVAQRVHKLNPKMRLILLLRNPVTRAMSDFMQGAHNKRGRPVQLDSLDDSSLKKLQADLRKRLTIGGTVNSKSGPIRIGCYNKHLQRWLKWFPRQQIFVASTEEFTSNPVPILIQLEKFLSVDKPVAFDWEKHITKNTNTNFFCLESNGGATRKKKSDGKTAKRCLTGSKGRDHIPFPAGLEEKLYRYFAPYNQKLFQTIGQKFNWVRGRGVITTGFEGEV